MTDNLKILFDEFVHQQTFTGKKRPATIEGYKAAFRLLTELMPEANIQTVQNYQLLNKFFEKLETRERVIGRGRIVTGVKASTVGTYYSKLNAFFKWLKNKEHIKVNPFTQLSPPDVEYLDRKFLMSEDVQRLFNACGFTVQWSSEFLRRRNMAMLSVLLYAGLRKGELLGLENRDIDLVRKTLTVRAEVSKSKKVRILPMNHELVVALGNYIALRRECDTEDRSLWIANKRCNRLTEHGFKHFIATLRKKSGVKFHAHQLRHTFAVNLVNQGTDISKLKQLLGHRDIRMTAGYLRAFPSEALRDDISALNLDKLI
jgi:site-specific recombinase XerD